jgi:YcxB-like protein
MRIEYELKFRDYLLFNAMHQLLSVPVQLLYGGFAAFIFYSSLSDQSLCSSTIVALLAYLAMWAVQLLFNVIYLYFGKNRSLLTKHIVEIQDDAFYEETQFNRSYHYWPGLAKVISRPGFIAVYINANAAHIIPRRAFSSASHRLEFLVALRGKLSAA